MSSKVPYIWIFSSIACKSWQNCQNLRKRAHQRGKNSSLKGWNSFPKGRNSFTLPQLSLKRADFVQGHPKDWSKSVQHRDWKRRILNKIFKKVPDRSGGHRNRPIQLTEILNIPKFSVWQIRKNARSHAWIAWSEPTLKSTRKSGRHYSRVTQCVPAWPWPVQDVCRLLQVTSITGNKLYLILTVLVFF